jgi:P27 family predicted phage terminase small subunit
MRGRKPQATAIKEGNGAFVKDPQRKNHEEPRLPMSEPECSEAIKENPEAFAKWKQVIGWLTEMRVIASVDHDLIETYAMTYAEMMENTKLVQQEGHCIEGAKGLMVRNPRTVVLANQRATVLKMIAELGLSPSSRTRLKAAPQQEEDVFGELMKRMESLN